MKIYLMPTEYCVWPRTVVFEILSISLCSIREEKVYMSLLGEWGHCLELWKKTGTGKGEILSSGTGARLKGDGYELGKQG